MAGIHAYRIVKPVHFMMSFFFKSFHDELMGLNILPDFGIASSSNTSVAIFYNKSALYCLASWANTFRHQSFAFGVNSSKD